MGRDCPKKITEVAFLSGTWGNRNPKTEKSEKSDYSVLGFSHLLLQEKSKKITIQIHLKWLTRKDCVHRYR